MKAFNVTHCDDRRLCSRVNCDSRVIAFQWDHAVRDFRQGAGPGTVCCQEQECRDPSLRDEDGLRCMHRVHDQLACISPPSYRSGDLPPFEGCALNLQSDEEWITHPTSAGLVTW